MAERRQDPAPPRTRREKAADTRLRVLRAAHQRFVVEGYSGTRMADVATDAGVAVQTVYFIFHTKPELLTACYDLAVLGAPDAPPPPHQGWHLAMMDATTPDEAVRHFVVGTTAICERVAVLDDIVRATVHEPDAVSVHQRSERLRRRDFDKIVGHLGRRFGLREGLTRKTCLDLVLTYSGPSVYRQLVVDHGWSRATYDDWLRGALRALLAG